MEGTCEHSDICGLDALEGHDGMCILHSKDFAKSKINFNTSIMKHLSEKGLEFCNFVFPTSIQFPDFKDKANFKNCIFAKGINFSDTCFEKGAVFSGSTFKRPDHFEDDQIYTPPRSFNIQSSSLFRGSEFNGNALFLNVTFEDSISFQNVKFTNAVDFSFSTFERNVHFVNSIFEGDATFCKVDFERELLMSRDTSFRDDVTFSRSQFGSAKRLPSSRVLISCNFSKKVNFSGAAFEGNIVFDNISPYRANYNRCTIRNEVLFSGSDKSRTLADSEVLFTEIDMLAGSVLQFKNADLSRCRFRGTDLRKVDFTGVKWYSGVFRREVVSRYGLYEEVADRADTGQRWVDKNPGENEEIRPWSEIERLYRDLKKNHEQKGDYPRAGDFHIGEKESRLQNPETGVPVKILLYAYKAVSKYGERAMPAFLWLLIVIPGFAGLYILFDASLVDSSEPLSYVEVLQVSIEASLYPVQPIEFEGLGLYMLSVIQRVISPILLALLALALRQRVKR